MGLQDVIAILIASGAVVFTARYLWRSMTGEEGCHSCPTAMAGKSKVETPQLKRTPLVTLDTSKLNSVDSPR
jgi:hypothetical protein